MVYTLIDGRNDVKMFKTQVKGSGFTAKLLANAEERKKQIVPLSHHLHGLYSY